MASRHFRHKHPLFRKSSSNTGTSYTQSPYYFWWEFLRRHEGYRETCLNRGNGPLADLYMDFGDVHSKTFREWWSDGERGARLFAEPPKPVGLDFVGTGDLDRIRPHLDNGDVLLLSIPVKMDKKSIINRFEKLLRKVHPRKRGQRDNMDSNAMYPIIAQCTISSLQKSLQAYDLSKTDPKPTLWEIGQKLKFGDTLTKDELNLKRGKNSPTVTNKQNKLSVAASKKIQLAKSIIEGVGQGVFPRYK